MHIIVIKTKYTRPLLSVCQGFFKCNIKYVIIVTVGNFFFSKKRADLTLRAVQMVLSVLTEQREPTRRRPTEKQPQKQKRVPVAFPDAFKIHT